MAGCIDERKTQRVRIMRTDKRAIGWTDLAWLTLDMTGFLAGILLMTWGIFVFAFLCLGGFSLNGMMHQLANLSSRYIAASAERVLSFQMLLLVSHLLLSLIIIGLRRHRIPHV